jgi:hypothetical protein
MAVAGEDNKLQAKYIALETDLPVEIACGILKAAKPKSRAARFAH